MSLSIFDGPIPGQSLTDEPGNYPWERPPVHADPLDALEMYMKKLGNEDVIDNVIDMLDVGVPVNTVASAMLTMGFAEGEHSVDTKFILMPFIAAHIKSIADVVGVDYKLDMTDYKDKDAEKEERSRRVMAAKIASKLNVSPAKMDEGDKIMQEVQGSLENNTQEEDIPMEEPQTVEAVPSGLMARG